MISAYEGSESWQKLQSLCYALQHFGDSLVLMMYGALLDRWSERSFSYTLKSF